MRDSPRILTGRSFSSCSYCILEPRIMISVFLAFSFNLLETSQRLASSRHSFNLSKALAALRYVRWMKNWVPSSKKWNHTLGCMDTTLLKGVVYREKRMGPRTELWGSPNMRLATLNKTEPIFMQWVRLVRYELNQWRHLPLIPNHVFMQSKSVLRWMVTNATDWSSNTTAVASLLHLILYGQKSRFSWMALSVLL